MYDHSSTIEYHHPFQQLKQFCILNFQTRELKTNINKLSSQENYTILIIEINYLLTKNEGFDILSNSTIVVQNIK